MYQQHDFKLQEILNYWNILTTQGYSQSGLYKGKYADYNIFFKKSELSLGFSSSPNAAQPFYSANEIIKGILSKAQGLQGIMTWDISSDNLTDNFRFSKEINNYLKATR